MIIRARDCLSQFPIYVEMLSLEKTISEALVKGFKGIYLKV